MTNEEMIKRARALLPNKIGAIRYLRRAGLTFQTARTIIAECQQNAPWYAAKCYGGKGKRS